MHSTTVPEGILTRNADDNCAGGTQPSQCLDRADGQEKPLIVMHKERIWGEILTYADEIVLPCPS